MAIDGGRRPLARQRGLLCALAILAATTVFSQSRNEQPAPTAVDRDIQTLETLWSGGRYKITPGDVLELTFVYTPEFNQTVTVQPDGYITLRSVGDVRVAGTTVPMVRVAVAEAYVTLLREPTITIVLKDFEKPYFIAAGEVARPGKYDLRGMTTLSEALAVAGGPTSSAKKSEVLLFRRHDNQVAKVTQVNIQKMYKSKNLTEDPLVRAGDTLFVPRSSWSAIAKLLPRPGLVLSPFIQ